MNKSKMYWWVRLYRKFFGKHPGVYVKEEVRSIPCEYLDI
jgi:hypothetical protein